MAPQPVVVQPGEGHRVGNVEFLARTADTPRFTFGIIEIVAGRELEAHVHADEDDAFYILEGELTFTFGAERVSAPPGAFVLVPPGVEHGFRNDTGAAGADAQPPRAGRLRPPHRARRLTAGAPRGAQTPSSAGDLAGGDGLGQPLVVALVLVGVGGGEARDRLVEARAARRGRRRSRAGRRSGRARGPATSRRPACRRAGPHSVIVDRSTDAFQSQSWRT